MAIKKSELYSSIWKSCDNLRGGMDASQYKDYVLVLLFVKYVSDKYAGRPFAPIVVPEGGSFDDMVEAKGKSDIGERLNKIINRLAEENELTGVINTADFDDSGKLGDGKEMQDRLTNLIAIFEEPALDFSRNRADGDDLLGDAYEYLMRNFATQSGKSKGQFYTPAEVSRVMSKIIGLHTVTSSDQTIYDPTCGSGSLLLKAADEIPASVGSITLYGQEKDNSTRALAQMNMILHNYASATIKQGNTLSNPLFKKNNGQLETFDFAVANPPFSDKAWTTGLNAKEDEYRRFVDGIPPEGNGDYAFLQHFIRSLKSKGKGAIILPHGVLFRGNTEADIRQNLVQRGYIKGIIGLPPNLFYGTGIPACIIVIDKENAQSRRGIFMIDASKGFVKDGNKNRLRYQDIHKIVDVFNNQTDLPRYSRMVTLAEIEENDYNLNIPRYIDTTEPEDIQDIEAHLLGGIPNHDLDALEDYWEVLPSVADALFTTNQREGYSDLKIDPAEIKATIFEHPEFISYGKRVEAAYAAWRATAQPRLKGIQPGDQPKQLIFDIAEDLLKRFDGLPLIDKYDIYQHLMSYWADVMQDDVHLIADDGWQAGNRLRQLIKDPQSNKYTEAHDFEFNKKRYKAELVPPALVIARDYPEEQAALDALDADLQTVAEEMTELDEEHSGEDGLLADARSDSGKVTKGVLNARLKEIANDPEQADELAVLQHYQTLLARKSDLEVEIKAAEAALHRAVIEAYAQLNEDELKTLIVEDKWLAKLGADVQSELDRVSQRLAGRIKELAERYADPLPQIEARAATHRQRVADHLKRMGFSV